MLTKKNKITTKRLKKNLHFRPIQLTDIPFLQAVYASTRADVQNNINWTTLQKDLFLQQQFHAQHTHYQTRYKGANFDIVLLKRQAIGRLYIHRKKEEIRLMDIALLPDYQNQSIGTFLVKNILEEGRTSHKIVSLHVDKFSPALKLYERLGFEKKGVVGERFFMEWKENEKETEVKQV